MTYSINTPEMAALLSWLKAAREKRGLSMRDLSLRLDKPHSYVQKVEQGERRLDVVEFVWYCEALSINPMQGIKLLAAKKWATSLNKAMSVPVSTRHHVSVVKSKN